MRIKTKTILIVMLGIAALAAVSVVGWRHFHNIDKNSGAAGGKVNTIDYGPPTDEQKQAGERTKQQNLQQSTKSNTPLGSTTITIARLGQVSPGENVNLRAILTNNVSGGQCVVTFTKVGYPPVTQTVEITTDPSDYSCEPIDISPNQFGNGGTWEATVYVQQNGSIVSNKATGSAEVKL
jgi:hypothetical protein